MKVKVYLIAGITTLFSMPLVGVGCSDGTTNDDGTGGAGTGGFFSTGGSLSSGGAVSSGGSVGTGGVASGGVGTGGASTGGASSTGGDGTGGDAGPEVPATFETLKYYIFSTNPSCASSDCHGVGHGDDHLVLGDMATLYQTLTTWTSEKCGNRTLVVPGDVEASALIHALKGTCENLARMPKGCMPEDYTCVPDVSIAALEKWIQMGAPEQ